MTSGTRPLEAAGRAQEGAPVDGDHQEYDPLPPSAFPRSQVLHPLKVVARPTFHLLARRLQRPASAPAIPTAHFLEGSLVPFQENDSVAPGSTVLASRCLLRAVQSVAAYRFLPQPPNVVSDAKSCREKRGALAAPAQVAPRTVADGLASYSEPRSLLLETPSRGPTGSGL